MRLGYLSGQGFLKLERVRSRLLLSDAPHYVPVCLAGRRAQSHTSLKALRNHRENEDEWQTNESKRTKKRKKLPKKDGSNYPAVYHSHTARLQSFVKLSDLQNLALYMLADGTAPQWCAVKHHASVRLCIRYAVLAPPTKLVRRWARDEAKEVLPDLGEVGVCQSLLEVGTTSLH